MKWKHVCAGWAIVLSAVSVLGQDPYLGTAAVVWAGLTIAAVLDDR